MTSIGAMIQKLGGMIGTEDLTCDRRSHKFVMDMVAKTENGKETRHLSEPQVKWIEDLHEKHFA